MTLNNYLHRYEGIVLKKSEQKTELACEFLPVADWYLFKTNHGRYFTCKDSFKNSDSNVGKNWRDVEFDSIVEGRAYPF